MILRYLKWPEHLHYEVDATVLDQDADGLWLLIRQGTMVDQGTKGTFAARAAQVVLVPEDEMWTARWFRADDRGRGGRVDRYACYVDITTPAIRKDRIVQLVDLDLDVVRTWDDEVLLLDEDEFLENESRYPQHLATAAVASADALMTRLRDRIPPFDGRHEGRW